jgi:hypothetical protein
MSAFTYDLIHFYHDGSVMENERMEERREGSREKRETWKMEIKKIG